MVGKYFDILPGSFRIANLVLGIISLDKILHDASTFEDSNRFAICEGICDSWNSAYQLESVDGLQGTVTTPR